MTASNPTPALNPTLIARLRDDVKRAQWSVEHLSELLSPGANEAMMRDSRLPALVELEGNEDPAAILTRLFVLGNSEKTSDIDAALPTLKSSGLAELGLAAPHPAHEEHFTALFDLRPHAAALPDGDHEWWVASDLGEAQTGQPLHDDHVLGIGGATLSLLGITIRDHVESALDVGCGCGIQALYLTTHATRVVATDLSERACELTRFNAILNNADIDVRCGSLFEPVEGENFDLIVSNPPFVITPDSVRSSAGLLEYRDGGMDRDNLIATIIATAPRYLTEGGRLQMLANWEIPASINPDTQWSQRVRGWLEGGVPVDAWVVQRDVLDPARYVDMWIRDSGGQLMERTDYEAAFTSWLADFARVGTGAIGMGFVALRRLPEAEATPVIECDLALDGHAPRGDDVAWALRSLRTPQLWDLALIRASDVREERHYVPGSSDPELLILRQGGSLGKGVPVSSAVSAVVGASDGELTVGQIAAAVAMLTERETEDVRAEVEGPLRELIRWGFLRY